MSAQSYTATDLDNAPNINLFVGLPGAGKSVATATAKDVLDDATRHELSDYVRYAYEQEVGGDTDDNSLGRWAAEKKNEHGMGHFARGLAASLQTPYPGPDHRNVAGVRSPEEADAFRDVYGPENVTVITIWTMPDLRFERLEDREGEYTREEFHERKERELWDWGCIEFFTNPEYYDYIAPNNFEREPFEDTIETILRGHAPEDLTTPPFPDGLSQEHIASYL